MILVRFICNSCRILSTFSRNGKKISIRPHNSTKNEITSCKVFSKSSNNLMFSLVKLDWVLHYVLHCWSSCKWDSRALGSGTTWLLFSIMENSWFCYAINFYYFVFIEGRFVQVHFSNYWPEDGLQMTLRWPKITFSNVNKWYGKWNELFDKWDVAPYEVNVACKENDGQLSYHASYAKGKLSQ